MRKCVFVLWCLLVAMLIACGGSGGSVTPAPYKGMKVSPSSINLKPNELIQLTAIVDGGTQAVVWSLPNQTNVPTDPPQGSFVEPGKYKAPVASGDYTVRATLVGDVTKYADAVAHVDSGYVVNISSSGTATIAYGGTKRFTATVAGAASNDVTWSAISGTITATGDYTAPSGPVGTPTFTDTITATSRIDPSKKKTFVLTIAPPVEIVAAGSNRVGVPESRFTFQAKAAGTVTTSGVNWSASSGSINASGVWTADATTLGDVTITASLASDPTKTATATVNVQANLNVRFKFQDAGDIVLALRPDKAPKHCANLVSLVNEGFYTGIRLHRREDRFVIQWGDPLTKTLPLDDPSIGTGGPGYTINFEANDLKHVTYALGMARSASLDSGGSQIYVCLADLPSLDGNYVVFGSVIEGTPVVDLIQRGDTIVSATVELVPSL